MWHTNLSCDESAYSMIKLHFTTDILVFLHIKILFLTHHPNAKDSHSALYLGEIEMRFTKVISIIAVFSIISSCSFGKDSKKQFDENIDVVPISSEVGMAQTMNKISIVAKYESGYILCISKSINISHEKLISAGAIVQSVIADNETPSISLTGQFLDTKTFVLSSLSANGLTVEF